MVHCSGRKRLPDVKSTEDFVAVLSQNRSRLARYHPHTRCCDVNGPRGCIHTSLGLHLTERRIDIHGQCPSISTSTTYLLPPKVPAISCNTLPSSSIPFFHTSGTNQSLNSILSLSFLYIKISPSEDRRQARFLIRTRKRNNKHTKKRKKREKEESQTRKEKCPK